MGAMDLSAIIGTCVAVGAVLVGLMMSGGIGGFFEVNALIVVFGGALGATALASDITTVKALPKLLKTIYKPPKLDPRGTIAEMVGFAEKARKEGVLSLDKDLGEINDEFIVKAVQLLVDGTEPELIKDILENEVIFLEDRHKKGVEFFALAGAFAPACGLLATVIGLVSTLAKLNDPSKLGSSMALALVATFYGIFSSNIIFQPFSNKLKIRSEGEVLIKTMIIEGVMSIQSGDNPRLVEEKLKTFLPPKFRTDAEGEKGESKKKAGATAPAME